MVKASGAVYRTQDGGRNWAASTLPFSATCLERSLTIPSLVLAGTDPGAVQELGPRADLPRGAREGPEPVRQRGGPRRGEPRQLLRGDRPGGLPQPGRGPLLDPAERRPHPPDPERDRTEPVLALGRAALRGRGGLRLADLRRRLDPLAGGPHRVASPQDDHLARRPQPLLRERRAVGCTAPTTAASPGTSPTRRSPPASRSPGWTPIPSTPT